MRALSFQAITGVHHAACPRIGLLPPALIEGRSFPPMLSIAPGRVPE
jgi:hypothetical protein